MSAENKPIAIAKPLLQAGSRVAAIVPDNFESAYRLATVIKAAGMAPKSFTTAEQITVAMMHGMEVGLTPMAALQSIAVVNGMPTIWGDGALAIVRASGLLTDIDESMEHDKGEPIAATCRCERAGQKSPIVRMFTRSMAQKAGLWGKAGPWQQHPGRMLQMRARSWALRDGFADVLRGMTTTEEARDMPRDVTGEGSHTMAEPKRSDFAEATVVEATGEATPQYPIVNPAGEVVAEAYANDYLSDMLAHTSRSGNVETERAWIDANKATALQVAADDDTPAEDRTAILGMYAAAPEPKATTATAADDDIFPGDRPSKGAKR